MFSSLYPLLTVTSLKVQLSSSYPKLFNWLENMSANPSVSRVLAQFSTIPNWAEVKKGRLYSKLMNTHELVGNTSKKIQVDNVKLEFSTDTCKYTLEYVSTLDYLLKKYFLKEHRTLLNSGVERRFYS